MLDQWQWLTQGSRPVSEYISKFDEFLSRCYLQEDEQVILFRFRAELKEELQRELLLREISILQHAYQIAQEVEMFTRVPAKKFEAPSRPVPSVRPPQNQQLGSSANSGQHGAPLHL